MTGGRKRTLLILVTTALLASACEELPTAVDATATPSPAAVTTLSPVATTSARTPSAEATAVAPTSTTISATPVSGTPDGVRIVARIHPEVPELAFTLVGDPPADGEDEMEVRAIDIRRADGAAGKGQTLTGFTAQPLLGAETASFVVEDTDFDGYNDIRLMAFVPAGPNIPYLFWRYDPQRGAFVRNAALDPIPSPQFNAASERIVSQQRVDAATHAVEIYRYEDDQPLLERRETRRSLDDGRYRLTIEQRIDGGLQVVFDEVLEASPPLTATSTPRAPTPAPSVSPLPSATARAAKAIQFPPGATSTVVEGDVGLDRADRYTLRASGGQIMVLGLQLPDASDTGWLRVVGPEGFASPPGARLRTWIGRLPVSAEYVVEVRTMVPHAARYQLGIGIETITPQRVFFALGDTGAALSGALPARGVTAYRLGASAGQLFRLAVQPMGALAYEVLGPDGRPLSQADAAMGSRFWELPADGDYDLLLGAPFEAVEYRASLEIRSPAP